MRGHGIARIVQAIMDAPETAVGLDLVKERARDAGFKAGYSRCSDLGSVTWTPKVV
ncbi:hypothetical protein HanXRQr2_Chr08g0318861 [Helianthus annuus]|uniref:Uncharacterized protein n=1 Tax=Helianthus annuus TaxID=4232 RepID=A0A9K3IBI6_HELAN|nr:hypothetical protein HanXRQr2_Chr08g0318861 [Helianthus annuus]